MRISDRKKMIKSLLSGKLTQEKRQSFLDVESVEKEIEKQWDKSGKELVSHIVKEQMWKNIKMKCEGKQKSKAHIELWRFAAASVAILIISGLWFHSQSDKTLMEEFINVTANESQMYLLPDSSKVWMQPGSTIRFAKDFNKSRKVWLNGNSLFEVYKHEGSTFQVYINKAFIEVKGTCFLIKQNSPTEEEITLFNGKIDFNVETTGQKIVMKPLQKMIYNPSNAQIEIQQIENINWENGKFNFIDIPLPKLIETINRMYQSDIILEKEVNKETAFTGSIRHDEPLGDVISKICFSLNLKQEKKNNKIIILQN